MGSVYRATGERVPWAGFGLDRYIRAVRIGLRLDPVSQLCVCHLLLSVAKLSFGAGTWRRPRTRPRDGALSTHRRRSLPDLAAAKRLIGALASEDGRRDRRIIGSFIAVRNTERSTTSTPVAQPFQGGCPGATHSQCCVNGSRQEAHAASSSASGVSRNVTQ